MYDLEIETTFKELAKILNPKALDRIKSHVYSLDRAIEDLIASRENWKSRAIKAEKKLKRK